MIRSLRPVPAVARGAALLALLPPLLLGGCGGGSDGDRGDDGGPVTIATPPAADRAACRALAGRLPRQVAGLPAVATTPRSAYGAAWGDPPITLTCGVGVPKGFGPASSCLTADGVDWFAPDEESQDNGSDITLTSVTLRPRVALRVPARQRGATVAAALVDLAGPLRETLRMGTRCQ